MCIAPGKRVGIFKQRVPLIGDTIAIDFAVMNKQLKGILKRIKVEDSEATIDLPQAKRQHGDGCAFSLPSSPACNGMLMDQVSTSPPREKATGPK